MRFRCEFCGVESDESLCDEKQVRWVKIMGNSSSRTVNCPFCRRWGGMVVV